MRKYQLYGMGAALVDTEIEVSDQELDTMEVEKGLMTLVDAERQQALLEQLEGHLVHAKMASGGSACNSVVAASYFGGRCFFSCKVARDTHGDFYLNDIKQAGVGSNFDLDDNREDGMTGKCLVLITPDAERSMNTHLSISETLSTKELAPEALSDSEYLYLEGYLVTSPTGRAAAIEAHRIAKANGVKTALSFSDPGMVEFFRDGIEEMLDGGVDLVFCNEAEALGWAQSDSMDDAIAALKQVAKQFVITRGAEGAILFDGESLTEIGAHKVKAVDTNGAGDMFAGAFLYGICNELSFENAGRLASRAAAEVVSQYGPRLAPEQHKALLDEVLA